MAHRLAAIPMTLTEFQGHSPKTCLYNMIFRTAVSSRQDFIWHSASRGLSAITTLIASYSVVHVLSLSILYYI